MKSLGSFLGVVISAAVMNVAFSGCSNESELYCTATQPCTAGHPFCDVEGVCPQSGGVGNTCLPSSCLEGDGGTPDASVVDAGVDATMVIDAYFADAQPPPLGELATRFGGNATMAPRDMVVDDFGNVYIAGSFTGIANFGGGSESASSSDLFVVSYDVNGTYRWALTAGSGGSEVATALGLDSAGNVIAVGTFENTISLGGGSLTSAGGLDIWMAKLNASTGQHVWSVRLAGADGHEDVSALEVAPNGDFVIAGQYWGTPSFGSLPAAQSWDMFVGKFRGTNGSDIWVKGHGSDDVDNGLGVALDSSGDVAVVGTYRGGNANFGGANLPHTHLAEIFIAKYSGTTGAHAWSFGVNANGNQIANAVDFDSSDNLVVTGGFQNTVDFGGGNMTSAGSDDVFVAHYAGDSGTHVASERYGSTQGDSGVDIQVVGDDVWVVGSIGAGSTDFGGGNITNAAGVDVFLAHFDGTGAHAYSSAFGNASFVYGSAIWATSGNVWIAGRFPDMVNFNGSILSASGTEDMFIVRLAP